ncbi:GLPGLI family protein [Chryseobacterium sp. G0162]|uniref:GLPGLI family protein n=1 Tax=Chryseobacterium nakagawai TaxID=1241982 RepID=A0AAD1DRB4_CHRNA|nr:MULTISPECIES: GLPGLI family protein [Chryseobacterium]AZA91626.1 GLPGLI family protein [Chryseobacterium nakagawai]AZB09434.1 GLPGLI family protein [Chryseobacterium sp. G0162]VEH18111.1 GLPGLI family protein [Chryseobacterium nakagawai]
MKKLFSVFLITLFAFANAQEAKETANRFFYELTFKPKKDSVKLDKLITILDITPKKSIYQDYTIPSQDSIIKLAVEEMEKAKTWKDISKLIRMPKFAYKIVKTYPEMKEQYVDRVSMNLFGYDDPVKFTWNILPEKQKIGEYNTQKATTEYGGRKWTAWFSSDIPFQDGPYKFYGLPGLIVKIEDDEKNYSWMLSGNKKIENYDELSYSDKINAKYGVSNTVTPTTKEKFDKAYASFKQDPMAEIRQRVTPEMMNMKMPGSDVTIGDALKRQEKMTKDYFNSNDNPIEKDQASSDKKKK